MKYKWEGEVLKHAEGGPGTATLRQVLDGRPGIKVKLYPSSYVGQTHVRITMEDAVARNGVIAELVNYGYEDTREDAEKTIRKFSPIKKGLNEKWGIYEEKA